MNTVVVCMRFELKYESLFISVCTKSSWFLLKVICGLVLDIIGSGNEIIKHTQ